MSKKTKTVNSITLPSGKVLDRHDILILSALSSEPRLPASELGHLVHLSRTAVSRRLVAMKESGVFAEQPRVLSYEALGFTVHAFVELYGRDKSVEYISESLLQRPEVLRISVVASRSLLHLEVIAVDIAHLNGFMKWLQSFGDTETKITFAEWRSSMSLKERIDSVEGARAAPRN
ncbi:MAG: AsnC family transcriptional regulator [Woeseiaceae bacterium]|nr:AsnC family transcriptional regulator [Woeseiaceae bacterium]